MHARAHICLYEMCGCGVEVCAHLRACGRLLETKRGGPGEIMGGGKRPTPRQSSTYSLVSQA